MKIMTILGTRPEIIRLSLIIEKLDRLCEQVVVHTGQNYDRNLNDIFFEQLGVRRPDHYLGAKGTLGEQLGVILSGIERVMVAEKPDKFLVLGDTNSSVAAIMAKRMGIPVYHMEAGNRCYDDRVPEEVNRRIIDHSSDMLLPYTEQSRHNLLREGIPGNRILVTGNPIKEVIDHYAGRIEASTILEKLGLGGGCHGSGVRGQRSEDMPQMSGATDHRPPTTDHRSPDTRPPAPDIRQPGYFLVTLHRAENVDVESRLRSFAAAFRLLSEEYGAPVIVSTHPRTRKRLADFGMDSEHEGVRFLDPFGFFDFVALERSAKCVLTDSGTVQEECCIFRLPNITLRDVTERQETLECGSNMLTGADPDVILACVRTVLSRGCGWTPPGEYLIEDVSDRVVKILLDYFHQPSTR